MGRHCSPYFIIYKYFRYAIRDIFAITGGITIPQPCYIEDLKGHEPCKSSCLLSGNFSEIKHFLFDFTDKFIAQDRLTITCYITIFFRRVGKRKDFHFQCFFIDSIVIYLRSGKRHMNTGKIFCKYLIP